MRFAAIEASFGYSFFNSPDVIVLDSSIKYGYRLSPASRDGDPSAPPVSRTGSGPFTDDSASPAGLVPIGRGVGSGVDVPGGVKVSKGPSPNRSGGVNESIGPVPKLSVVALLPCSLGLLFSCCGIYPS